MSIRWKNPGSFRVLFVCIGNCCRSPLAEGIMTARLAKLPPESRPNVEVCSAGVQSAGYIHPQVARTMSQSGHDTAVSLESKDIGVFTGADIGLVVFLSDRARRNMRWVLSAGRYVPWVIWPTPDPITLEGNKEAQEKMFAEAGALLECRIGKLLELPFAELGPKELVHRAGEEILSVCG